MLVGTLALRALWPMPMKVAVPVSCFRGERNVRWILEVDEL